MVNRSSLHAVGALVLVLAATTTAGAQVSDAAAASLRTLSARTWVVIIGVNEYDHPKIEKLRYALNDAQAVKRLMLRQGIPEKRVITLFAEDATKKSIEQVLGDRLRREVGPEDRVLVFFAGHGLTVPLKSGEEEGYLLPVDTDPDAVVSTSVSMTYLRQVADFVPAKQILFIVDACYSGYALFKPRSTGTGLVEEFVRAPSVQILTAGRKQDQAQERAGHGVFTEVLVRALEGEAFAADRDWLALSDLGNWVRDRVYTESRRKQVPQVGNLSGEGQFVFVKPGSRLALTPPTGPQVRPRVTVVPVAPKTGTLVIRSPREAVDVWLDDEVIGQAGPGAELLIENLVVGPHRVRARAQRQESRGWERDVEVAADQRHELTVELGRIASPPPAPTPAPPPAAQPDRPSPYSGPTMGR